MWAILDDDLRINISQRKRYFGMTCSRCQQEGHRANECTQPVKSPVCYMCGSNNHFENRCPQKQCLTVNILVFYLKLLFIYYYVVL